MDYIEKQKLKICAPMNTEYSLDCFVALRFFENRKTVYLWIFAQPSVEMIQKAVSKDGHRDVPEPDFYEKGFLGNVMCFGPARIWTEAEYHCPICRTISWSGPRIVLETWLLTRDIEILVIWERGQDPTGGGMTWCVSLIVHSSFTIQHSWVPLLDDDLRGSKKKLTLVLRFSS